MIEKVDWSNCSTVEVEWAIVENKYGKLLCYNLPRFNKAYANLTYQGYITEMLESGKYDIFVDLGASMGLFSQVAAHHCQYVIAYECHPLFYGLLLNNMKFHENVECKYKYVGLEGDDPLIDTENVIRLVSEKVIPTKIPYYIEVVELDNELYYDVYPKGDDYCNILTRLTLIKLDVEGAELNVLEGAKRLLRRENVHWIIDVHIDIPGITLDKVRGYFPNRKITLIGRKVLKVEGVE
jgi:FkbM family methyltransferase